MSYSDLHIEDKLNEIFEICALHLKRMHFAHNKVSSFVPLNIDNYFDMSDETISFLDQYIFRFSKLQDTMGTRLFPTLMDFLAEPINDQPFINLLNRLERLGIIDSAMHWIELRRVRNDISHEYPTSLAERVEGINILFEQINTLSQIVERCKNIAIKQ